MKKLTQFLMLLAVAGFVYACGGAEAASTPEDAAKGFFVALGNKDFSTAKSFGTKQSQEALEKIESGNTDNLKPFDFKTVTCTKDGDTKANCTLCCNSEGAEKKDIIVVKEGEKWLVDMNKEQITKKEENFGNELNNALQEGAETFGNAINETNEALENAAETMNESANGEGGH